MIEVNNILKLQIWIGVAAVALQREVVCSSGFSDNKNKQ